MSSGCIWLKSIALFLLSPHPMGGCLPLSFFSTSPGIRRCSAAFSSRSRHTPCSARSALHSDVSSSRFLAVFFRTVMTRLPPTMPLLSSTLLPSLTLFRRRYSSSTSESIQECSSSAVVVLSRSFRRWTMSGMSSTSATRSLRSFVCSSGTMSGYRPGFFEAAFLLYFLIVSWLTWCRNFSSINCCHASGGASARHRAKTAAALAVLQLLILPAVGVAMVASSLPPTCLGAP
mmetsp:Transcript_4980/g.12544  ORF Transcript_4980/g.12544 Transcript_4980/m.12544 type:complete len:232 (-) Transcript_4980:14-709(-)